MHQQRQRKPEDDDDSSEREDERLQLPQRPISRTLSTQSISRHVAYSPVAQHALSPAPPSSRPSLATPIQSQAVSSHQPHPETGTFLSTPGFPPTVLHNPHVPHPHLHYHPAHQHPPLHLSPTPHPPQMHHSSQNVPIPQPRSQHHQLPSTHVRASYSSLQTHPQQSTTHHTHPPPQATISAATFGSGPLPHQQAQPHHQTHSPYAASSIHYYSAGPSGQIMMPPPPGTAYYPIPTYHMEPLHPLTYYHTQYPYAHTPAPVPVPCDNSYNAKSHQTPPGARMEINKHAASSSSRRKRLKWTDELHQKFLAAIEEVGAATAVPKTLMQSMNVPGLTRENIASHLQKYRMRLKEQQAAATSEDTIEPPPAPPPTSSSGRSDRQDRSPCRNSSSQRDPSPGPSPQDTSSSHDRTPLSEQRSPPHTAPS